jgi:hypothetical protein
MELSVRDKLSTIVKSKGNGDISIEEENAIRIQLVEYFAKHINNDFIAILAEDGNKVLSTAFLVITEKPANPTFITGKTGTLLNVGGPPNILSVQFPTTIYAGQQATGTIAFEDAKKSVASARFDVVEATSFPGFTVGTPEAAGRTSGTISFRVNSPTPQHVVLQAVLVDAAGRQSKPVPFAFDIRTPPAGSSKGRRSPREWSIQMPHGARSQLPR